MCLTSLSVEIDDLHTSVPCRDFILQNLGYSVPQQQHYQTVQACAVHCINYLMFGD